MAKTGNVTAKSSNTSIFLESIKVWAEKYLDIYNIYPSAIAKFIPCHIFTMSYIYEA